MGSHCGEAVEGNRRKSTETILSLAHSSRGNVVYTTRIVHQSDSLALAIIILVKLAVMTDACWGVVRNSLATLSVIQFMYVAPVSGNT